MGGPPRSPGAGPVKRVAGYIEPWHDRAMRILALLLTLTALPAAAQGMMTAGEFDAYTEGKTFTYGSMGAPYGTEQYLKNRRVRWSFENGQCQEGGWYEQDGLICFTYDTEPEPQCWSFRRSAAGLIAQFENDPSMTELYEVERSDAPLTCSGPDVGV